MLILLAAAKLAVTITPPNRVPLLADLRLCSSFIFLVFSQREENFFFFFSLCVYLLLVSRAHHKPAVRHCLCLVGKLK